LHREAYCQFGISAWSQKGFPAYITSNPYTAKCYAHVVLGYLRDGLSQHALDLNHPIYLFDLGAGTGRFAYLFLKELFRFIGKGDLSQIRICYVMTDIATDNIAYWQKHPYLKPYYEKGVLDCAQFYHSQEEPIHLMIQNKILTQADIINPVILIANYFFDTIPQDLFRVRNGLLEEGHITISTSEEPLSNTFNPNVINHLKFCYTYDPVESALNYYEDANDNAILEMYRNEFKDSTFLFPVGALQVLRTFRNLSRSRLLLLAGDQGVCTSKQVQQWGEPVVSLHGSFSIAVSYHALAALFNLLHGKALLSTFPNTIFVVMGGVLNQGREGNFHETELAFQEHIDSFQPVEYWQLVNLTEKEWKEPPLDHVLMLVKLGNWDAMSFYAFFPRIKALLPKATQNQKDRLAETIHRIWENYYPVAPEEHSFVHNLGVLFFEMGLSDQASIYFKRAHFIATSLAVSNSR
jgi:hypothetical protein